MANSNIRQIAELYVYSISNDITHVRYSYQVTNDKMMCISLGSTRKRVESVMIVKIYIRECECIQLNVIGMLPPILSYYLYLEKRILKTLRPLLTPDATR